MEQEWKVLLLGGNGAVGKSTLARQLSEHYKVSLLEVDDVRIALQQIVDEIKHPDLFTFINDPDYLDNFSTDDLVQKLVAVGRELTPALKAVIGKHIACNEPVIIEGDSILPELAAQFKSPSVKTIFLYDDKENLKQREQGRSRGGNLNAERLTKQVDFAFNYGEFIKARAESEGLMTIKASPVETLFERVLNKE